MQNELPEGRGQRRHGDIGELPARTEWPVEFVSEFVADLIDHSCAGLFTNCRRQPRRGQELHHRQIRFDSVSPWAALDGKDRDSSHGKVSGKPIHVTSHLLDAQTCSQLRF